MRFYSFVNFYLSSIQQGIQTAHLVHEMYNEYNTRDDCTPQGAMLDDWSRGHKTIMTMNGGNNAALQEFYTFLSCDNGVYPFIKFHEDEQSLGGVLTGVAIVLPEVIYETAARIRAREVAFVELAVGGKALLDLTNPNNTFMFETMHSFTPFEIELIERLNTYGLAK
jgi:hypothetical protein